MYDEIIILTVQLRILDFLLKERCQAVESGVQLYILPLFLRVPSHLTKIMCLLHDFVPFFFMCEEQYW